jgi:two-component sensor histidine kinase
MTELAVAKDLALADPPGRARAKERLYVFLQLTCWGLLAVFQIVFTHLISSDAEQRERVAPSSIQLLAVALLITHFGRRFTQAWGWKDLGWKSLVPRVIGFSMGQAAVLCAFVFVFQVVLLGWLKHPDKLLPILVAGWINCTILFLIWHALYYSYHLFDRFNRMEIDRLRLMATVKHAELRALKSQLNPHFIFNALNSLRALIDEDPQRARSAVTQLANLLRYSLQSGQLETVPFEEELKVVKDYLSLEQVRHEERLRLRLDVSEEALTWLIPPMLLQTLVENAVKYGISTRPQGGEIGIAARVKDDSLVLQVTNPGHLEAAPQKSGSTGLGLINAAERLRLLLGERSSLQLRAEGMDTVIAEAVLPRQLITKLS